MRQFLAIEPSGALRAWLAELEASLQGEHPGWRWLAPASMHLTLRFLGEIDSPMDDRCRPLWRRVVSGAPPFTLGFGGVGCFPRRGPARVTWVAVADCTPATALSRLAEQLESAAREGGLEADDRRFAPHLTLARARSRTPARIALERSAIPGPSVEVTEIVLFRSELRPRGARYTALERLALGRA